MCFDFLYNFSKKKNFILSIIERGMVKLYVGLRAKYPFFMSDFNESLIFCAIFLKKKFHFENY